jgi:hypothetical protein
MLAKRRSAANGLDSRSKRSRTIAARRRTEEATAARVAAEEALAAAQPREAELRLRLNAIQDTPIPELRQVVDFTRGVLNVQVQHEIIHQCLRRILSDGRSTPRNPRPEQVRTLRRLIYGKSDVLLIARTGFGKSIIFHAYSILTGLITI